MLNAKLISSSYNDAFLKQLIWIIMGYFLIFIVQKIKIKSLFKFSFYFYLFSLFLLILVLIFGTSTNGAKCWLQIFGFSFQPSEIAKLALTIFLIELSTKMKMKNLKDEFLTILKLGLVTLVPCILVFLEPDTGAIINFLLIFLTILFFLPLRKRWYITFFSIFILFILIFFLMYFFFQDTLINLLGTSIFYRMDRLINFTNGNSYQLENALITIGAASFLKFDFHKILLYIPEAPTDFFFAFSIGNYGILVGIFIIVLFALIDFILLKKITKLKNAKAKLFGYSYLSIFIFHQVYNIGMNLGLLPIMGIPLPFLSYGGTNTLINYLFLGIFLNLEKQKIYS